MDAAVATCKVWTLALHTLINTWHNFISKPTISLTSRSIRTYRPFKKFEDFFNSINLYPLKFSLHQSCAEILKYTKTRWLTIVTCTDQPPFQLENLSAPSISCFYCLYHYHYGCLGFRHRVLLVTQPRTHTEGKDHLKVSTVWISVVCLWSGAVTAVVTTVMNLRFQKWLKIFCVNVMLACPDDEGVNILVGPNLGYETGIRVLTVLQYYTWRMLQIRLATWRTRCSEDDINILGHYWHPATRTRSVYTALALLLEIWRWNVAGIIIYGRAP